MNWGDIAKFLAYFEESDQDKQRVAFLCEETKEKPDESFQDGWTAFRDICDQNIFTPNESRAFVKGMLMGANLAAISETGELQRIIARTGIPPIPQKDAASAEESVEVEVHAVR